MTNLKYKCFGKVKFRKQNSNNKYLDDLQRKKLNCENQDSMEQIDYKINNELEKRRKENLENPMKMINDGICFRQQGI